MTSSYYDVVVLGTDLAPLTCAALLAKRGFRVLVLGQQRERPDYAIGPYRLPRHPFTFTAGHAPIARRIFGELGIGQSFKRITHALDPAFQVALPGHRFDVNGDESAFEREVEREFPEVRRPVIDFYRRIERHARSMDAFFERDLIWPPESLLGRREIGRLGALLELDPDEKSDKLLAELPDAHPFRAAMLASVAFSAHSDPHSVPALQFARLLVGRLCDAVAIDGGLAALSELLMDKVRAHSGDLRPSERASQIITRRGAVSGVRLFGSDEEIGCARVVAGIDVAAVTLLLADRAPLEELFERSGEPQPRYYRYTLNAIVRACGVPEGMKRDVFCIRDPNEPLHSENLLHVEVSPLDEQRRNLCVEALLPARTVEEHDGALSHVRERVLDSLRHLLPFIDQDLVALDSPHDGRNPLACDATLDTTVDPFERRGPQTMRVVYAFPLTTALGICAMPVTTPLRGLLLCNEQVAPALGLEGQLVAAASAAHAVTRADRGREWLRRRLWAKVEF